jgi:myo-inositol-1(or 4)-monophosphatase
VACGRLNGYFERDIKLWDYAAGALIATEAGATIELPCPENADLVAAAEPGIFGQLRILIQHPAA